MTHGPKLLVLVGSLLLFFFGIVLLIISRSPALILHPGSGGTFIAAGLITVLSSLICAYFAAETRLRSRLIPPFFCLGLSLFLLIFLLTRGAAAVFFVAWLFTGGLIGLGGLLELRHRKESLPRWETFSSPGLPLSPSDKASTSPKDVTSKPTSPPAPQHVRASHSCRNCGGAILSIDAACPHCGAALTE